MSNKNPWIKYETVPEKIEAKHYRRGQPLGNILVTDDMELSESGYIVKKDGVQWYTPADKFKKFYRKIRND